MDERQTGLLATAWETYGVKNDAAAFAGDIVGDVMLPGHGFGPRESCGQHRIIGCLDSSHNPMVKKIKWSCHSRNCNSCWRSWCQQRARAATGRILSGIAHLAGPAAPHNAGTQAADDHGRRILHIAVSVPPDARDLFLTHDGRAKLRKEARQRLGKVMDRIDGGAIIDHGYRFTDDLATAEFSPHFHFLVSGWFNMDANTALYEKEGGFIVKYLSSLETTKDLYSCIRYLLSHSTAAIGEVGDRSTASHAIRYYGEFGYNKYKSSEVLLNVMDAPSSMMVLLSRNFNKEDVINETRVTLMEVPYRYQKPTTVTDQHCDANATWLAVLESFRLAGAQVLPPQESAGQKSDYPAITKSSNICMVCGLGRSGPSHTPCKYCYFSE